MSNDGKIKIGIERFLWKYPLLGGLVATWAIVADTTIPTMAIGFDGRGFLLYFNPEFVDKITMDQLVGVVHHEARHAIYGHCFLKPADYPDQSALTIAEETTVNENLPEPLPGKPIRLRQYPQLKKNTDTDTRYKVLARPQPKEDSKDAGPQGGSALDDPASGDASGQGDSKQDKDGDSADMASAVGWEGKTVHSSEASKAGAKAPAHGSESVQTVDDHSRWGEIIAHEAFARSVLDNTVQQIIKKHPELSEYERKIIERSSRKWGTGASGNWSSELGKVKSATLNWKVILRRYVGNVLHRAPSYSRPPRRFPHLLGIVPGVAGRGGKPNVMAVIDTSGSMGDSTLGEISSELTRMARDYEVTVAELDSVIHRVYHYKGPIRNVLGRGENDFHPIFEVLFLRKYKPDVMVIFTDGFGPAPDKQPQVPVIWALTEGGAAPVTWGQVVQMVPKPSQPP